MHTELILGLYEGFLKIKLESKHSNCNKLKPSNSVPATKVDLQQPFPLSLTGLVISTFFCRTVLIIVFAVLGGLGTGTNWETRGKQALSAYSVLMHDEAPTPPMRRDIKIIKLPKHFWEAEKRHNLSTNINASYFHRQLLQQNSRAGYTNVNTSQGPVAKPLPNWSVVARWESIF